MSNRAWLRALYACWKQRSLTSRKNTGGLRLSLPLDVPPSPSASPHVKGAQRPWATTTLTREAAS